METDYLKFFQSFIASLVQMGGINLLRSNSTMLGRNLGEIYKKRGVTDFHTALKSMFRAMGGKTVEITDDKEGGFTVETDFGETFCPIGGAVKPKRHEMFFEGICKPYAIGFLSAFKQGARLEIACKSCVLKDADSKCIIQALFK
ncbi:MAG: hypothetical protein JW839_10180 [Candidatus Lokiarchaeota archaeon]|nr:hypothetical protein [Candidatus Lokiarchaeota archaeon]